MASLIVSSGPNATNHYPLGNRTMVIGRDEGCPIQIVDEKVSRKHVQIRHDNGRYVATDMKSANGTLINGRQLTGEVALEDDDVIAIGSSTLMFSVKDFKDRQSALDHWRKRGERVKPTMTP